MANRDEPSKIRDQLVIKYLFSWWTEDVGGTPSFSNFDECHEWARSEALRLTKETSSDLISVKYQGVENAIVGYFDS